MRRRRRTVSKGCSYGLTPTPVAHATGRAEAATWRCGQRAARADVGRADDPQGPPRWRRRLVHDRGGARLCPQLGGRRGEVVDGEGASGPLQADRQDGEVDRVVLPIDAHQPISQRRTFNAWTTAHGAGNEPNGELRRSIGAVEQWSIGMAFNESARSAARRRGPANCRRRSQAPRSCA